MLMEDLWDEAKAVLQRHVPFDLNKHTAVVFRVGSHAHGTYVPPEDPNGIDDVDLMVVVIPPPSHVLGMVQYEHTSIKEGHLDIVVYEWSKWLRLISKSNPNVVGTLWNNKEDVLIPHFAFTEIHDLIWARRRVLSRRMYPAFNGYARAQLHKMTHNAHQGYMGLKRKALVEKFGYDTKNAAHLVRLLRMACEVMENGSHINVRRVDAHELIDIKQGRWTLEQVKTEADKLFDRAAEALERTSLPSHPDEGFIEYMMVNGYFDWWRMKP